MAVAQKLNVEEELCSKPLWCVSVSVHIYVCGCVPVCLHICMCMGICACVHMRVCACVVCAQSV